MAESESVKAVLSNSLPLLKINFGANEIKEPGEKLSREVAASEPTVAYNSSGNGKHLLVNIDLDAPFSSFSVLAPVLHWLVTDLTVSASKEGANGFSTLTAPEGSVPMAHWAGPGPPPGSAPHRYVFLLYEQPEGFSAKEFVPEGGMKLPGRMRFRFEEFEKKTGLGKPIAGNWFVASRS